MAIRARLQVERLDERVVPTTSTSVEPVFPLFSFAHAPVLPTTSPHALAGQGQGAYIGTGSPFFHTPVNNSLLGTAFLNRLGSATLHGAVHGVGVGVSHQPSGSSTSTNPSGLLQSPFTSLALRATGTMMFTNVRGSVTIDLAGPLQSIFAALPEQFTYRTVARTGAFAHLTDNGTLTLTLQPTPANQLPPTLFPNSIGTFTTTIAGGIAVTPTLFPTSIRTITTPTLGISALGAITTTTSGSIAVTPTPRATSGITGVALIGPTVPLSRVGVTNVAPLPGAVIAIVPAAGGPAIARVVAGTDGLFSVPLQPGTYRLIPMAPRPGDLFPHAVAQPLVSVLADQYTPVVVSYDSGIR